MRMDSQLTWKVATIAANMRNTTHQNMIMQEIFRKMSGQGGQPISHYAQQGYFLHEDEV